MKSMKSVIKAAVIAALVMVMGTCGSLPGGIVSDPKVTLDSMSITGISFTGIDFKAQIKIQNDNPMSIPFPEIKWNLFVSDASFLSGEIKKNTKIAARKSTVVELPLTVSYEGLYKTIAALLNADEAPYRIDLAARFPLPVLENKTFETSFKGNIPMLKMPSLSFGGIKFNSLSLSKVEFVLTWTIDNKNAFAINLDKLNYNFAVNGSSWSSGAAQRTALPARRATQIPITVGVGSLSMIQEILALSVGGKTANYTCAGETALIPQIPGFQSIAALELPFSYSGTTTIRR